MTDYQQNSRIFIYRPREKYRRPRLRRSLYPHVCRSQTHPPRPAHNSRYHHSSLFPTSGVHNYTVFCQTDVGAAGDCSSLQCHVFVRAAIDYER